MIVWLEIDGACRKTELHAADGSKAPSGLLTCTVNGVTFSADARILQPGIVSLIVDGQQHRCVLDGSALIVDGHRSEYVLVDPRALRARGNAQNAAEGELAIKAPMPGQIVRVLVEVGDAVEAQQGLVVIEAMKMQNELKSPRTGRVARVHVAAGDTVAAGSILVTVES